MKHMANEAPDYDPRYLGGILFFNAQDYFEAHEVWEHLWLHSAGPGHTFYQGLIQAAVALYHFENGNLRGAAKLFHSSRDYLAPYGPRYLGLATLEFWAQMERCFAPLLADPDFQRQLRPMPELLPKITLDPPPAAWPNPADFAVDDDEDTPA
jgi:predicted metal-dependent hydrolase